MWKKVCAVYENFVVGELSSLAPVRPFPIMSIIRSNQCSIVGIVLVILNYVFLKKYFYRANVCEAIGFKPSFCSVKTFYKAGYSGIITSPKYPQNYDLLQDYYWRIATYGGRVIELKFDDFELEGGGDCAKDFVKVYDGLSTRSRLIETLCGSKKGAVVSSTNRYIFVHFRSDESNTRRGFRFTWKGIRTTTATTTSPNQSEGNFFYPTTSIYIVHALMPV